MTLCVTPIPGLIISLAITDGRNRDLALLLAFGPRGTNPCVVWTIALGPLYEGMAASSVKLPAWGGQLAKGDLPPPPTTSEFCLLLPPGLSCPVALPDQRVWVMVGTVHEAALFARSLGHGPRSSDHSFRAFECECRYLDHGCFASRAFECERGHVDRPRGQGSDGGDRAAASPLHWWSTSGCGYADEYGGHCWSR